MGAFVPCENKNKYYPGLIFTLIIFDTKKKLSLARSLRCYVAPAQCKIWAKLMPHNLCCVFHAAERSRRFDS